MPSELSQALIADSLAERYGARPADVLRWDSENLKIAETALHYRENQPEPAPKQKTLKEQESISG